MANQHIERNKKGNKGSQVREKGEVDDVFTSSKDEVVVSEKWWMVCVRRVFSGHGRVSRADKVVVPEVSWGCQVNKAGRVALNYIPYPPFVLFHVSVNSWISSLSAASTIAHNSNLNHDIIVIINDHLGAT